MRWIVGLCLLGAFAGCSPSSRLVVHLKTDLVAPREFATVVIQIEGRERQATFSAMRSHTFLTGVEVARFGEESRGAEAVIVSLLDQGGEVVLRRRSRFPSTSGPFGLVVVMTRDCLGVECGDQFASECLNGECVPADCVPSNLTTCEAAACQQDADCTGTVPMCARYRCSFGACLVAPDEGSCGDGESCDPGLGCVADCDGECEPGARVMCGSGERICTEACEFGPCRDRSDAGFADSGGSDAGVDSADFVDASLDTSDGAADVGSDTGGTGPTDTGARRMDTGRTDSGPTDTGRTDTGPTDTGPLPPPPPLAPYLIRDVAIGGEHTCLVRDGDVYCFGDNTRGQLGVAGLVFTGTSIAEVPPVVLPEDVAEVVAGANHTCARTVTGTVYCWGAGSQGQLGLASTMTVFAPTLAVVLPAPAVQIAASQANACALLETGSLYCWGANARGQIGVGHTLTIGDDEPPQAVPATRAGETILKVSLGQQHVCAQLTTPTGPALRCWGQAFHTGGAADHVGDDEPARDGPTHRFAGMTDFTCTRVATFAWSGTALWAFGNNDRGQLGRDAPGGTPSEVALLGFVPAAIGGGSDHTCALSSTGAVRCFGSDAPRGVLGLADPPRADSSRPPTDFPLLDLGGPARALFAGVGRACVIVNEMLRCFGNNNADALGVPTSERAIGDDPGEMPPASGQYLSPGDACDEAADSCVTSCVAGVCVSA